MYVFCLSAVPVLTYFVLSLGGWYVFWLNIGQCLYVTSLLSYHPVGPMHSRPMLMLTNGSLTHLQQHLISRFMIAFEQGSV